MYHTHTHAHLVTHPYLGFRDVLRLVGNSKLLFVLSADQCRFFSEFCMSCHSELMNFLWGR